MSRTWRRSIASIATAFAAALLSFTAANAESKLHDTSWSVWATELFAKALYDQAATSSRTEWPDASVLGYARTLGSDAAAVRWLPQPLPAVDGINGKIDGYGGGAKDSDGFFGGSGSLSFPLAQRWGLQLDGDLGRDSGIGGYGGGAHLFWRDPSVGLLGGYVYYAHWNGTDLFNHLTGANLGHISATTGQLAAEGEYYLNRWTLSGLVGVETVSINSGVPLSSPPKRFFDDVWVSYYVTNDFALSAGHSYTLGTHYLSLGGEYGVALGSGRMASFFVDGWIGERADNGVLAGLRVYFGQHDKSLIDRHRQDDPPSLHTPGIAATEAQYTEMWAQDAAANSH